MQTEQKGNARSTPYLSYKQINCQSKKHLINAYLSQYKKLTYTPSQHRSERSSWNPLLLLRSIAQRVDIAVNAQF